MSTLNINPFGADTALHGPAPPGHISSARRARKDGDQGWDERYRLSREGEE